MLVVCPVVCNEGTVEDYLDDVRRRGAQNDRDEHGIPTLCSAIDKFHSLYLVEELIKDGVDVNIVSCLQSALYCQSTRGRFLRWGDFAPIHIAVSLGLPQIVKLLWENGADLKSKTSKGTEPVDFLSNDITIRCSEKGFYVSEADDYEIVKLMYTAGVDLNTKDESYRQSTLLHRAIGRGNLKITRYLVSHGCDVNSFDCDGKAALQYCDVDALECAKILLQNDANPNSQDNFGNTIYHHVWGSYKKDQNLNGCLDFLRLLHNWNVDPNVRNHDGQTALHVCFKGVVPGVGSEEIMAMLKHGADPNATDELGRTPIYYLISDLCLKTLDMVFSLLIKSRRYGAILNKVDIIGMPLLHLLVETCLLYKEYFDSKRFIELLQPRCSIEVNCQDMHNRTVLHLASAKGNWTIAEILLNHGACTEVKDCDDNTPLHVAILCKQWVFARKLLLLPLRHCGIESTLGNTETNIREENSKVLSEFKKIRRNNSIAIFPNQIEHIHDIFQNNKLLHCLPEKKCQSTNKTAEQDKIYVASKKRSTEWTSKKLNIITKYADTSEVVCLDRVERKDFFNEVIVCPSPTIDSKFLNQIRGLSLLELCEKNCVGEFHLIEDCKEEHCLIVKQVFRLMSDLVQKCSEIDPRLESKLFWTGSSADGTKMWLPNEFDFLMELVRLQGSCVYDDQLSNSFRLRLKKEYQGLWSNLCLRHDSFILSSIKLKRYISILLWKAGCLLDRNNYQNIRFRLCRYDKNLDTFIKTTNVGINITVFWRGEKYRKLMISIDLTPAISVDLTVKESSNIHKHSVGSLLQSFIHVIPYVNHVEQEKWRPSFSLTEVYVIKKLSRKERAIYKGLKFFRDIHKSLFAEIPSYHLKTFLLNHLYLDSSYFDSFLAGQEGFHFAFWCILFRLDLAVNQDIRIQHFFLNYHFNLGDYDFRWIKSALDILEQC